MTPELWTRCPSQIPYRDYTHRRPVKDLGEYRAEGYEPWWWCPCHHYRGLVRVPLRDALPGGFDGAVERMATRLGRWTGPGYTDDDRLDMADKLLRAALGEDTQ